MHELTNSFDLQGREYIELHNLLKFEGWCASGAEAKNNIAAGLVIVDKQVETRKRCKIFAGQVVEFAANSILVKGE